MIDLSKIPAPESLAEAVAIYKMVESENAKLLEPLTKSASRG